MCEKCDEIDKAIERYRLLQQRIVDPALLARSRELIAEFETDKAALHQE